MHARCSLFTVSVKKTVVMGQDVTTQPLIALNNTPLEVASKFSYLWSIVMNNLSLDDELSV